MKETKVIIIGAGICGLTAAIALRKMGVSVKVYEKTSRIKNIGGGIFIYPHGIRIIKLLGLDNTLNVLHSDLDQMIVRDVENEVLMNDAMLKFYQQAGSHMISVSRTELQLALLNSVENSVIFDHCLEDIIEEDDSVTVKFSNGVQDRADIVIGADGIHSKLRQIINNSAENTIYKGFCTWGGILPENKTVGVEKKSFSLILGNEKMAVFSPLSKNRQMWYILCKINKHDLVRDEKKINQLKDLCNDWSPFVDNLLNLAAHDDSFAVTADEVIEVNHWVKGRIALIGDAAHAFGPVQGQGTSVAMEDAYILANCVKSNAMNISAGLMNYQKIRMPVVNKFKEIENMQQKLRITSDPEIIDKSKKIFSNASTEKLFKNLTDIINDSYFNQQIKESLLIF